MKSFFATAAIAAIVTAYDAEDAMEDIIEGEDPAHAIEHVIEDRAEDLEKEIERFLEDIECWWADRNNGDGECAARSSEQEIEDCIMSGKTWYWDTNECLTWEQFRAKSEE